MQQTSLFEPEMLWFIVSAENPWGSEHGVKHVNVNKVHLDLIRKRIVTKMCLK